MFFEELEYKYRADGVKLTDFKALIESRPVKDHVIAASWDIYYSETGVEDSFQRYRMDKERPELTKKVKTQDGNNWVRIESDLPLDPRRVTEKQVAFHVGLDGYKENFRIFKYCDIYFEENLNYVYYTVYDENMKEIGRFIEVEVNKNKVQEFADRGLAELKKGEERLVELGITPQHRLKKSLFEIYRKGNGK